MRSKMWRLLGLCAVVLALGCESSSDEADAMTAAPHLDAATRDAQVADDDAGGDGDGGGDGDPLYALTTTVLGDAVTTTYVALIDSLEDQEVDLDGAAEFPEWASMAAF